MNRSYLFGLAFLLSGVVACTPPDEVCANGLDDNEDGLADCADVEACGDTAACRENCNDNVDNDADGQTDCDDDSCAQDPVCLPESLCDDGVDNDEDGASDCADGDCVAQTACQPEDCENGIDDNGNGDVDCDDAGCFPAAICQDPEDCAITGVDEDNDGLADCLDPDCAASPNCQGGNNQCNDGADNDGDVLVDAADPACQVAGATIESNDNQCSDGIDNDFDGSIDNNDSDCGASGHEANAQQLPDLEMFDDDRCEVFPTPSCQPNVRTVSVTVNDPEFQAGCYTGFGQRRIMEWNSIISNVGNRPLVVGNTSNHQPIWTINQALGQLEFFGWTRSFLRDTSNTLVGAGHKGSFCMIDLFEVIPGSQAIFSNCNNGQGINDGMGDVYSVGLECQFIDITGLPAGDYTLEVQTDFTKQLPESNYNNNASFYDVSLP